MPCMTKNMKIIQNENRFHVVSHHLHERLKIYPFLFWICCQQIIVNKLGEGQQRTGNVVECCETNPHLIGTIRDNVMMKYKRGTLKRLRHLTSSLCRTHDCMNNIPPGAQEHIVITVVHKYSLYAHVPTLFPRSFLHPFIMNLFHYARFTFGLCGSQVNHIIYRC